MRTQAPSRWLKFPDPARWGASGPEVPWIEVQCPNHGVFRVQSGVLKVEKFNLCAVDMASSVHLLVWPAGHHSKGHHASVI